MAHVVTMTVAGDGYYLRIVCSCGRFHVEVRNITLADLNDAIHEHIEASETDQGYVTKSALTSEDQLIDLTKYVPHSD